MPTNATEYVLLWIYNEEHLYRYFINLAKRQTVEDLRQALKEYFLNDNFPLSGASVYSDLLTMTLNQTDWQAVAADLIENAK